jgi:hypothetical protein
LPREVRKSNGEGGGLAGQTERCVAGPSTLSFSKPNTELLPKDAG